MSKVKNEIDSVLRQGVISPVTVPTGWCSGIVPVPKPNGRVRIFVAMTPLNKPMQRELIPWSLVHGRFPTPTTVRELQRFMGMVNQLGKFVSGLDDIRATLRQLLRKDGAWYWDEAQQTAFRRIKEKLASPEIIAHDNSNRQTILPLMHHQQGLEQFYTAVPSDTSPDPSVMLKGTMQSLRKTCLPQPGHVNSTS